jgi:hypothetical protein
MPPTVCSGRRHRWCVADSVALHGFDRHPNYILAAYMASGT